MTATIAAGPPPDRKRSRRRDCLALRRLADLQHATERRILEQSKRLLCPVTVDSIHTAWHVEQAALTPLPLSLPQPFDVQVHRRVGRDCLVAFEGRQYSVPTPLRARRLTCAAPLYKRGEMVARFPRHTGGRLLVDQAHYGGPCSDRTTAPAPLGRMARQIVLPASCPT
ncbi:hypothetical protein [Mesorhizobium sp. dw_380]|uniref:Mu transposase domain-containing protein n=1 Tax=Mesorhizobium sp. dw_380 TaxID=2812001 RepID=UPI001BDE8497|nr:hypothetical protein [Mesorhizobium sp. dw_380]